MISIENLHKSFGNHTLFKGASFKINARERVGLVGRNGHGKTTLFRIITDREEADEGSIHLPKQYRIGYVQQHLTFTQDTLLQEGMTGLPKAEKDHAWKVEKILFGLGFSKQDLERHPNDFSGGYQVRLNLAKVLVSEPDLLLLDEPTNYLDITSIRWIERFLLTWPNELMLITHDRSFMDKVVTHTLGIHRQKIRKIPGNTEKYYTQTAQDEEVYEKTRLNDEKKKKEIELFISRFRAKARLANMVQSRVKTLAKMENRNKLDKIKSLDFSFRFEPFPAKQIMSVEDITFGYDSGPPLIKNLSVTVGAKDRICIVGKNGKGKTTLIKLLAGALSLQKGDKTYHPSAVRGFYEQTNVSTLVDMRTVEEEILYAASHVDQQLARNICGTMMFEGDKALRKISVLSGGEKSRVLLGKLLATPTNLLLLDEPTNHLDMDACDALISALDSFQGAVILVTHNEMFLHALADRLIVFQNDSITMFEGSYQRFLDKVGWQDEDTPKPASDQSPNEDSGGSKFNKKELRRKRSEIVKARAQLLNPIEKEIATVENTIESKEEDLGALNQAVMDATTAGNGPRIAEISQQIHRCQTEIDEHFKRLEVLMEDFDARSAKFEARLQELEKN
jgi:ATP-binding cassette, subfamily F, member 3